MTRKPFKSPADEGKKVRHQSSFSGQERFPRPSVVMIVFHDLARLRNPEDMGVGHRHRWCRALVASALHGVGRRTLGESSHDLGWSYAQVRRARFDFRHLPRRWQSHWLRIMQDACFVYRKSQSLWRTRRHECVRGIDWFFFLVNGYDQSYWTASQFFRIQRSSNPMVDKLALTDLQPEDKRQETEPFPGANDNMLILL